MGWSIKTQKSGEETQYRILSSIVDDYICEWMTKDELIQWFFWRRFQEFMEAFLKDAITFPSGWTVDGKRIFDEKSEDAYLSMLKNKYDDNEFLSNKFAEELKKMGISLSLSDGKYGFDTEED
jgi:hypothetical protein